MKLNAKELKEAAIAHEKRLESPLWKSSASGSEGSWFPPEQGQPTGRSVARREQGSNQGNVNGRMADQLVRQLGRALELRDSIGTEMQSDQGHRLLKALEYELRIAMQILKPRDQKNSERLGRIASGS